MDWWLEIGPTGGESAVGWADLSAWQEINGVELDPWEARTIRAMSKAFLNQQFDSRKPGCPAPYSEETAQEIEDRVTRQFSAMFKDFGEA